MKNISKYLIWVIVALPAVYLAISWDKIPDRVPIHYNMAGQADQMGSKSEFLLLLGVVSLVNVGVYFLLINIHRFDPKRKFSQDNRPRLRKLAYAISLFMAGITCFIIYSSLHAELKFNANLVVIGLGLLFMVMGNYFYSIKPNYFAGLRTPWALENEDNWRKTHQLGSKLWFAGGLLVVVTGLFLENTALFITLMVLIAVLTVVPIVYSYRLYARDRKQLSK